MCIYPISMLLSCVSISSFAFFTIISRITTGDARGLIIFFCSLKCFAEECSYGMEPFDTWESFLRLISSFETRDGFRILAELEALLSSFSLITLGIVGATWMARSFDARKWEILILHEFTRVHNHFPGHVATVGRPWQSRSLWPLSDATSR